MQTDGFSLGYNAFNVLGAQYESTAQEIAELVDDAEFTSSENVEKLQKAQQTLVTPRLRIQAEVSWLPELSGPQVAKVLDLLSNTTETVLLEAIANFPDLAKVNILADMAERRKISKDGIVAYLRTWRWFEQSSVLAFLSETRRRGGFPAPDEKGFLSALNDLKQRHAVSLIRGLLDVANGQSQLSGVLDIEIETGSPSPLVPILVREFEKRFEREQLRISDRITEVIEDAKSGSISTAIAITQIGNSLKKWDQDARPVLRFYKWRGHAEPRTKKLFQDVREFLLHLTNVEGKLNEAKELLLIATTSLAHAEELKSSADKDLFDLERLITERHQVALFQPLSDACDVAKAAHLDFMKAIRAYGMTPTARSPVGPFVEALQTYAAAGDANLAVAVARDLALFFNNEQRSPEIAYRILQGIDDILLNPAVSKETKARIVEDRETIFRNWKISDIEKEKGNLPRMTTLAEAAMNTAPPGVRSEFTALHSALMARRRAGRTKIAIWSVLIAIIVVSLFLANSNKSKTSYASSSSSYRPAQLPTNTFPSSPPPPNTAKSTSATPAAVDEKIEIKPTAGIGATLSRSELRYCVFQGKRLDLLRTMATSNSAIDKFNSMVSDFNLRCSNFMYRQAEMTAIEIEASSNSGQFLLDAAEIAKGW